MPRIGHRPMCGLMPMLGAKQVAGSDPCAAAHTANTARFTASSSQYMSGSLALPNSNTGTFSFWIRRFTAGVAYVYSNGATTVDAKVTMRFLSGNTLRVTLIDTSNNTSSFTSTSTITVDGSWHHVFVSFDNSSSSIFNMYIDGVTDSPTGSFVSTTAINLSRDSTSWWASTASTPASFSDACFADVWMSTEYVDPSVDIGNFISGGKPTQPGSDGSCFTGTQPQICLQEASTSFGTNCGSLGNFTPTGTLSDCASGPSD